MSHAAEAPKGLKKLIRRSCTHTHTHMFVETLIEDMRLKCCGYSRVESQGESPARSRTARGPRTRGAGKYRLL